jgi:MFS family permease
LDVHGVIESRRWDRQDRLSLLAVLLTRDPIQVSLLTTAFFLPWLVFALPSGAIIDRVDRWRTVVYGTIALGSVVGGVVAATFGLTAPLVVLGAVQGLLLVFGWRLMGRAAS